MRRATRLLAVIVALAAAGACVQPGARTQALEGGWRLHHGAPEERDGRLILPGVLLAAPPGRAAARWRVTPFLDLNGDGRRQAGEPRWPAFAGRTTRPAAHLRTGRLAVPDPRAMLVLELQWTDEEGRHRAWVPWRRR